LPSAANFVGVPVPDAPAAAAALLEQGIAVRAFRRLPVVGDLLRITVGPSDVMDRVAEALGGIQR
jgi:histidinol-phosphate/aromatic aminotransferase/cobyric acid decarboxylase-like protein